MAKFLLVVLVTFAVAVPAFSGTHKESFNAPCGDVWTAVKDTLAVPENYSIVAADDAHMTAVYKVKHSVHVTITGALRQRDNSLTLSPKETGCEMQLKSNYSGFEHNDAGDFRKRVDESLAKPKGPAVAPVAAPAAKPEEPAK